MRLLKRDENGTLSLTDDLPDQDIPEYVILSHTWDAAALEVTLQDFQSQSIERTTDKAGFKKIQFCTTRAAQDQCNYSWIDTCCIDKTNSVELNEAINSMFRWYKEAARCYVYLSDVHFTQDNWQDGFRNSRWFTRGWTLQEILAPKSVEFFSSEGILLGDKSSLEEDIHNITGIPVDALRGRTLSDFSVFERMSWASKRKTTRKEDEAYSLFGLFDIYMPLLYGERERALVRLREQIDRSLQGPGSSFHLGVDATGSSAPAPHPVRRNYRKVHVTILHWEFDELEDVVQRISNVFGSLYRYEVREIRLPHRHKEKLNWPWPDDSFIDDKDLQIVYYLGGTMPYEPRSHDFVKIAASPARNSADFDLYPDDPDPDERSFRRYPNRSWLSEMINIPSLVSDNFVVLDCPIVGVELDAFDTFTYLLSEDYSWARYLVLVAGYTQQSSKPGKLSERLMSVLKELATSGRFYAREGLITSKMVQEKLAREIGFDDDLDPQWPGNDGKDFIHLSPLPPSVPA